jgi:hypothetical protein
MTQYERVRASLFGEPTDRPPVIGGWVCHEDFLVKMARVSIEEFWAKPYEHATAAYKNVGADALVQFVLPKRETESTEGVVGRPTNFSKQGEPPEKRFPTVDSVIEWVRKQPSVEDVRRSFEPQKAYDRYLQFVHERDEIAPIVWIPGHVSGCPAFMWYSYFGYEEYFEAMLEAPEVFERFFAMEGEQKRLENAQIAKAIRENGLLPLLYFGEDICYSTGPMCSPDLLRRIYLPHLKHAMEPLVEADIISVWHSDGFIMPIIDDLIACGVDGFQGLEEDHGMSLETLSGMTNRNGVPLVLWGSVSVTSTLPHGSLEDVRRDIRRCIDIGAQRGGRLFLAPSSSVGPEVPTENIVELFRYGVEYGFEAYGRGSAR